MEFEHNMPLLPGEDEVDAEALEKDAEAFQALMDFANALYEGKVKPIKVEGADPEVQEVIDLFNTFIANGVDPFAVLGYVRMNVRPDVLTKAEPVLRQMIVRGSGYLYIPAGVVRCTEMKEAVRKSKVRPLFILAGDICENCVYRDCDHCTKIGLPLRQAPMISEEDVSTFAMRLATKYPYLDGVIREQMRGDGTPSEKFVRLLQAFVRHVPKSGEAVEEEYVDVVASLSDPELPDEEAEALNSEEIELGSLEVSGSSLIDEVLRTGGE